MAELSYTQAVTGKSRFILLDPMMAEVDEYLEDEQGDGRGFLSSTIVAQTRNCEVDPIRAHQGEKLLEGSYRNFASFLIRDSAREISIDESIVDAETARLRF